MGEETTETTRIPERILEAWQRRGVSRRDFLKFCTAMAATLSLPAAFVPRIAQALEDRRLPVIWLEFQACTGDTEALLRSYHPPVADLILDTISLEYHETIMAAAGVQAEEARHQAIEKHRGRYLVVIDGSIPLAEEGIYCTIGGHTALAIAREVCADAAAIIAVGTCAAYGGIPAAAPNPTGAASLRQAVPEARNVLHLPGCPVNTHNLTATLVHFLTFNRLPATDRLGRPYFGYRKRIHDNCERRSHFDAGQYAEAFGDEGHRRGFCLYKLGCKGPETFHNCPTARYNEGQSWPVMAGHGCIGCSEPAFWDTMSPFYRRLPKVPGFPIEATAERIGIGLAAVTAAAFGAHAVASAMRKGDAREEDKVKREE